jgi:hypothetical protein
MQRQFAHRQAQTLRDPWFDERAGMPRGSATEFLSADNIDQKVNRYWPVRAVQPSAIMEARRAWRCLSSAIGS